MPGLIVIRPADANECAQAWKVAVDHDGPTMLVLTRQDVPVLEGTSADDGLARGGYVLRDSAAPPDLVLIGTGSEVSVCVDAALALEAEGRAVRVVSLPCWELFEVQDEAYRDAVLPPGTPRLSVEAGTTFGWTRWADASVGIDRFGASAPGSRVLHELGMNPENVVEEARRLLSAGR
jgi:transketolase